MSREIAKNLKILVVVPDDRLGGAEQYLKMIVLYYLKQGAALDLIFLKNPLAHAWIDLKERKNLKIRFNNSNSDLYGFFLWFFEIIRNRRTRYDLIFTSHVHTTAYVGLMTQIGIIKKKYFIGRESTTVFSRFSGAKLKFLKALYKLGYPKLDLLVCQTDLMKAELIEAMPILAKDVKIRVVPNPIDMDSIRKKSEEIIDVACFGKYVVSAGRLISLKGFDLLISAISQMENKELNLVILGEGTEREALENMILEKRLENRIFLIGHVKNVYPYFKNAKCCVVSSRIEGFPNVLMQMMSQNDKVVSTRCAGGIKEISGIYTCKTDDVSELKKTMRKCLDNETGDNRILFDTFLKDRDINNFIKKIEGIALRNSGF